MDDPIYELKSPIPYAHKGEQQEASFISMSAPSFKQMGHYTPIKQAFISAAAELSEGRTYEGDAAAEATDGDDIDGDMVMQIMHKWSGDMTKVMLHAEQLFKSGVVLIDGEETLTSPRLQAMSMRDVEGLLGEYIANFIAPSLMDGTK